ncbi:band 4.1-like protein 4 isoform X2 [Anneissia japonica]|uniref:band 4.1-like protein 4 isoform X2 n=1 Tax=Anneissia japonica TaxID=1529436 RepID=UPI0014257E62|nr:band 4.1-like protein 4 isoform X2 [Anneissia japonica]
MDCFRRKQRDYFCCIKLLDETEITQDIQRETRGSVLLDLVYKHLNLLEVDYFGLRYQDSNNQTHWLEPIKAITRQITNGPPYTLYFGVKFYLEDPCQLKEEITRYQFFLQLKQDMLRGRLPCNFSVAAELCAYIVQSELGDFDSQKHQDGYISEFRFIPNQTEELEQQIMESHKTLRGQTPAVAEKNFLERAKWLDMYGVDLHPVRGQDQVDYYLGLTPTGIVVYKGKNKVSVYYWQRVVRVHYREREFVLTTKTKEGLDNEYIFEVEGKAGCKHLWKCCVDQHSFFRLPQMTDSPGDGVRQTGLPRGPKYRQNARTQKEALEISQEINRPPPKVYRAQSRRYAPRSAEQNTKGRSPPDGQHRHDSRRSTNNGGTTVSKAPEPTRTPHQHRRNAAPEGKTTASTTPWEGNERVGLYTAAGASPVSVRSMGSNHRRRSRSRSPGANSYRRQDTDRSDYSGNESESSRRHRHKHRSGSESEGEHQHRHRRRRSSDRMVDSQAQWEYIQQMQQSRGEMRSADDVVIRNLRNGHLPINPTPEQRMWRRARSHSGDRRASRELKKHIEYELLDTEQNGDPYDIPYKNIVTSGVAVRVTKSPLQVRKRSRSRDRKRLSQSSLEGDRLYVEDEDKFITLPIQQPSVRQAHHQQGYEPPYNSPNHQPRETKNGHPPSYSQSSPRREQHGNGEIRVVSGPVRTPGENGGRVPDVANVGERGMFGRQQEEKVKKMSRSGKNQDPGCSYYSASVYRVEIDNSSSPNPYLLREMERPFDSCLSPMHKDCGEDDVKFGFQRSRCDSGLEDDSILRSNSMEWQCKNGNKGNQATLPQDSIDVKLANTLHIDDAPEKMNIRDSVSITSECSSGRGSLVEPLSGIVNHHSLTLDLNSSFKIADLNRYMAELSPPVSSSLGLNRTSNNWPLETASVNTRTDYPDLHLSSPSELHRPRSRGNIQNISGGSILLPSRHGYDLVQDYDHHIGNRVNQLPMAQQSQEHFQGEFYENMNTRSPLHQPICGFSQHVANRSHLSPIDDGYSNESPFPHQVSVQYGAEGSPSELHHIRNSKTKSSTDYKGNSNDSDVAVDLPNQERSTSWNSYQV